MPSLFALLPTLVFLVLGAVLWARGYSLFRLFLSLAGLWGGYTIATLLNQRLHFDNLMYWGLVALLGLGLGFFFWLGYRICFLLAGASVGVYLVYHYGFQLFAFDWKFSLLIGAVAGGVLAILFHKMFIHVGTAWVGSIFLIDGIMSLIRKQPLWSFDFSQLYPQTSLQIFGALAPIALTVLGVWLQKKHRKNNPRTLFR